MSISLLAAKEYNMLMLTICHWKHSLLRSAQLPELHEPHCRIDYTLKPASTIRRRFSYMACRLWEARTPELSTAGHCKYSLCWFLGSRFSGCDENWGCQEQRLEAQIQAHWLSFTMQQHLHFALSWDKVDHCFMLFDRLWQISRILDLPSDGVRMLCCIWEPKIASIKGRDIKVRWYIFAEPWMALNLFQGSTLLWVCHQHATEQVLELIGDWLVRREVIIHCTK